MDPIRGLSRRLFVAVVCVGASLGGASCSTNSDSLADARITAIDANTVDGHRAEDASHVDAANLDAANLDAANLDAANLDAPTPVIDAAIVADDASVPDATVVALDAPATADARSIDAHVVPDATPPPDAEVIARASVAITSGPSGYFSTSSTPSFAFSITGPSVLTQCRADSDAFAPCSSPFTPTLADGDHTIEVQVTDAAGLSNKATQSFTIDTTPEPVWTQLSPAAAPSVRTSALVAYDEVAQQLVLWGGTIDSQGNAATDTWTWNGTTWTQHVTAHAPPGRETSSMVFDPTNKKIMLFGGFAVNGFIDDTWEWDGTDWTQLSPVHSPGGRYSGAVAADPVRSKVVLFGGSNDGPSMFADTWEWDGEDWTEVTPTTSPPGRESGAMAYDGNALVMFGGYGDHGPVSDTWTYDGATWTQRTTVFTPPARFNSTMAYDDQLQRVIMFGGFEGSFTTDLWEWTGSQWRQRSPATSPVGMNGNKMAYDVLTNQMITFGGFISGTGRINTTWQLQ